MLLSPHQDDELLTLGIPSLYAIDAKYDEVFIALLTDGSASFTRKKLGLDMDTFINARDREFTESCLCLGYKQENIIIPEKRISDGELTVEAAKAAILNIISSLPDGNARITVATISPNGTPKQHGDHHALGLAALELYRSRKCRAFSRLELYLEPYIYTDLQDRSLFRIIKAPDADRINASADSYRKSQYGIAFLSVPRELKAFLNEPQAYRDMFRARRIKQFINRIRAKAGSVKRRIIRFVKNIAGKIRTKIRLIKSKAVQYKNSFKKRLFCFIDRKIAGSLCRVVPFNEKNFTCTNYIYNRPDLFSDSCETIRISYRGKNYYIEANYCENSAELSTRVTRIPVEILTMACEFIFRRHPEVDNVSLTQSYVPVGTTWNTNHYRIVLPNSEEELMEHLPKHTRKNIIRRLKLLGEECGTVSFEEYENEEISDELVEIFFKYKKLSHNRDYNMTPKEYLERYHVTNGYVMRVNDSVAAIRFTCEQCDIVNAENFSYDLNYSKYSPGLQIYTYTLKKLIEKEKKQIFLGGGHQNQKLLFGSINEKTYKCIVRRKDYENISTPFLRFYIEEKKCGKLGHIYRRLRGADDSGLQRMCFFEKTHNAENLSLPDGLFFSLIDNVYDFEQFSKTYTSSLKKLECFLTEEECDEKNKIIERFEMGSVFCAIHDQKNCISSGWLVAGGDFRVSEIDTNLYMPTPESGILFDFYTEKEFRGRKLYPLLLRLIMSADKKSKRYIIYTKPTNSASLGGIKTAGFTTAGEYNKYSIHRYFNKLKWKIR